MLTKKTIQIKRYLDDKTKIIDVPLTALLEAKQDFALMSGDEVSIKTISGSIPDDRIHRWSGRLTWYL